jgi:hypothetical protein
MNEPLKSQPITYADGGAVMCAPADEFTAAAKERKRVVIQEPLSANEYRRLLMQETNRKYVPQTSEDEDEKALAQIRDQPRACYWLTPRQVEILKDNQ